MIKFIELTKNQYAIVDAEDYEYISQLNWHYSHGYARNGKNKYLHRILIKAENGDEVDHINRDKLDCRKSNLRKVSRSINTFNQPTRINNTSGHKGVWWHSRYNRWVAEIMVNYKKIHLGSSKDKEKAILLRAEAEKKYFGD